MERFKRTFSFRKSKKNRVPESTKPHQWQEDEKKVRDGTCSFQVRYLGCIEVFESRGMQVCEEAVKVLKSQCKGRYQRAVLYVSGDALRVVDEISKGLIVDQTIEKVSFCAPDRNQEKGFAYICRDGTTRRWMCHGFLAVKESGERLSHAVGCAFAVCLEKKQKRDKDSNVQVTFNADKTSFARQGSFRQTTLTEKFSDPQSAKIADPVPSADEVQQAISPLAVARPHASDNMLIRQGSFRGFGKLAQSSPFKRQLSLRLNDLPSTLQRQQGISDQNIPPLPQQVSPIQEVSPSHEVNRSPIQTQDSIAEMCQQLTQGLTAMTSDDPFASAPQTPRPTSATIPAAVPAASPANHVPPTVEDNQTALHGNPWATAGVSPTGSNNTPNFWLNTSQSPAVVSNSAKPFVNGNDVTVSVSDHAQRSQIGHGRSYSFDTGDLFSVHQQQARRPTLQEIARQNTVQNGSVNRQGGQTQPVPPGQPGFDPFDAAWAEKATNKNLGATTPYASENKNPFNNTGPNSVKQFEFKL